MAIIRIKETGTLYFEHGLIIAKDYIFDIPEHGNNFDEKKNWVIGIEEVKEFRKLLEISQIPQGLTLDSCTFNTIVDTGAIFRKLEKPYVGKIVEFRNKAGQWVEGVILRACMVVFDEITTFEVMTKDGKEFLSAKFIVGVGE